MPGAPSVVLEASGQPTCCNFSGTLSILKPCSCFLRRFFSASQTYIVVGGTEEGTVHLWDLRESNTLHSNR